MKEGLCATCTYNKMSYVVDRDSDGWTTAITWTYKLYNNVNYQKQPFVIDADGNTEEHIVPTVTEENLIKTKSTTYPIPTAERTKATHEEPHIQENEIAFQAAYQTWVASHESSILGKVFWKEINRV